MLDKYKQLLQFFAQFQTHFIYFNPDYVIKCLLHISGLIYLALANMVLKISS